MSSEQSTSINSQSGKVKLEHKFPISKLSLLQKIFPWLCLLLTITFVALQFDAHQDLLMKLDSSLGEIDPHVEPAYASEEIVDDVDYLWAVLALGVFAIMLVKLIYQFLYHLRFKYWLEEGQLFMRRGVLLRDTIVVPLMRTTEIELKRSWSDYLFGLADLVLATPAVSSRGVPEIFGLKHSTALKLQVFLAHEKQLRQ